MSEQPYGEYQEANEQAMAELRARVEQEADAAMEEAEAFLKNVGEGEFEAPDDFGGPTTASAGQVAASEPSPTIQRLPISLSEKRCEYRGHTLVRAAVCKDCGTAFTEADGA